MTLRSKVSLNRLIYFYSLTYIYENMADSSTSREKGLKASQTRRETHRRAKLPKRDLLPRQIPKDIIQHLALPLLPLIPTPRRPGTLLLLPIQQFIFRRPREPRADVSIGVRRIHPVGFTPPDQRRDPAFDVAFPRP